MPTEVIRLSEVAAYRAERSARRDAFKGSRGADPVATGE
ncbi:hypothetical protein OKW11_005176 [Pseudomonas baetica]|nr:hypothetical protein [Pseudomonas baetica]